MIEGIIPTWVLLKKEPNMVEKRKRKLG